MGFLTIQGPSIEPVTVAQMISYGHLDPNEDQSILTMMLTAARSWAEEYTQRAFIFQTKRLLLDFFPGMVNPQLLGDRVSVPFVWGPNSAMVGIQYAIRLPWPLVRQVVELHYQDPNRDDIVMISGTDYIADLDSQPARLTPYPGTYWPVPYITVNAVQVDYVTGYAGPITVSINAGSQQLISSFNFLQRDVGASISIPNAAAGGATPLNTTIESVDSNGGATLVDAASSAVSDQTTTFGSVPQSIQLAIIALATYWYEKRIPNSDDIPTGVKALLGPFRDLRV